MNEICPTTQKQIEIYRENKVAEDHRNDCLVLLGFSILIILSLVTSWLFKHKRFRFVHETGLSLIYGVVLGFILYNYPGGESNTGAVDLTLPQTTSVKSNCSNRYPPRDIVAKMAFTDAARKNTTDTLYYLYSYQHSTKTQHSEQVKELGIKATFNSEIFFNLILPPIIFCAGYSMKKKHFFENLGAIFTFAFIGTLLSTFAIGGVCYGLVQLVSSISGIIGLQDCLLFGSFISATDPVTVLAIFNDLSVEVDLYAIVFGESVLNDAVAIVLAEVIEKFGMSNSGNGFSGYELLLSIKLFLTVFLGGLSIGCFVGVITALLTKYTQIRNHPLLETSLFFMMSYCSFLGAEACSLSGIVASLFCGVTQAHYTYNNLSEESQGRTKEVFELLSFLLEIFVFVYIGTTTITFRSQTTWNAPFIFISLLAIVVGRAINIYFLSALLNLGRTRRIDCRYQNMLMFSGLRGAMAFALAIRNTSSESRQIFFTTTLVIVMATVFLCGGLTKPMVGWLKIRMGKEEEINPPTPEPINDTNVMSNQFLEPSTRHKKKALLIRLFSELDCKFIKPLLTHSPPLLIESCPKCCVPFSELLTTQDQFNRNARERDAENNFSLDSNPGHYGSKMTQPNNGDGSGVNKAYLDENKMNMPGGAGVQSSGSTGPNIVQFKRAGNVRDDDLELILSDDDEEDMAGMGDIRRNGDASSGLYLQIPLYESSSR